MKTLKRRLDKGFRGIEEPPSPQTTHLYTLTNFFIRLRIKGNDSYTLILLPTIYNLYYT